MLKLMELLERLPNSISQIEMHVGINDFVPKMIELIESGELDKNYDLGDRISPLMLTFKRGAGIADLNVYESYAQSIAQGFEGLSHRRQELMLAFIFRSKAGGMLFASKDKMWRARMSGSWVRPMVKLMKEGEAYGAEVLKSLHAATEGGEPMGELLKQIEIARHHYGLTQSQIDAAIA